MFAIIVHEIQSNQNTNKEHEVIEKFSFINFEWYKKMFQIDQCHC